MGSEKEETDLQKAASDAPTPLDHVVNPQDRLQARGIGLPCCP